MSATARAKGPRRIRYVRPWTYAKQSAFLFSPARWSVCEASTKTGKSSGCLLWLTEQAALHGRPGAECWWVSPVHRQAEAMLSRWKIAAPRGLYTANDSKRVVTLANGATIRFLSGEKPDNLYGDDVIAAVLDEASRMRPEVWPAVRSTLSATKGPARFIGNVRGRKNWFFQMARKAQGGAQDMAYAKLTAWDAVEAGILDRAEVEDAQRMLPEHVFRELYLAEPAEEGANPFGYDHVRACLQLGLAEGPVAAWGIDLAKSLNWTVMVGLNAEGRTCAFERFQKPWAETLQTIRSIVGRGYGCIDSTGVGDPVLEFLQRSLSTRTPTGPDVEQLTMAQRDRELARQVEDAESDGQIQTALATCPNLEGFKFTGPSKQALLEGYALAIQRHTIGLYGGPGEVVLAEHDAFEFEVTRTGIRYSAPSGFDDDCVMAYALAEWAWRKRRAGLGTRGDTVAF